MFYKLSSVEVHYGTKAYLIPVENHHDEHSVGAFVMNCSGQLMKIGHIAAEVAIFLQPILPFYRISW